MVTHERPSVDRQQPRLERARIGEPLYIGQRLVEIGQDYPVALRRWPSRSSWLRAIARELELRADILDGQPTLFP